MLEGCPEGRDGARQPVLDLLDLEAAPQRGAAGTIAGDRQSGLIQCLEWKSSRTSVGTHRQELVVRRREVERPRLIERLRTEPQRHAVVRVHDRGLEEVFVNRIVPLTITGGAHREARDAVH